MLSYLFQVSQQEKLHGALYDAPQKKALKALYRGKGKLESGRCSLCYIYII